MATSGKAIPKSFIEEKSPEVKKLAQVGCSNSEIAYILDISEASVNKHFKKVLETGRATIRAALRKAQVELAVRDKNCSMLIWLGKIYLDQKEPKHDVEIGGEITMKVAFFGEKARKQFEQKRNKGT